MSILKNILTEKQRTRSPYLCDDLFTNRRYIRCTKISSKADRHRYSKWRSLSYKKIGVEMLLVAFLGTIAAVPLVTFQHWLPARFGFQTREKYFRKFQQLSMKDISRFSSGSLLTRMTNDVDNVQQMIVYFAKRSYQHRLFAFSPFS